MPDQIAATPAVDASPVNELGMEIGSSLCSVWARYAGSRPVNTHVEFADGVVRWILPEGNDALTTGLEPGNAEGRTAIGYKRESSAVVSKATGRKVFAKNVKQDKGTGAATEIFILEGLASRN